MQTTNPANPLPVDPTTVAGLKVLFDESKYQAGAISGKSLFSNLEDFDFIGAGALDKALLALPKAEPFQVAATDGLSNCDRFQGIRNAETKAPYSVQSDGYGILQFRDMMNPVMEAAQAHDLHIAGKLELSHGGARARVDCIVANPEFQFQALQSTDSPIMLGFTAKTSHDGTLAFSLAPFAVEVICRNRNLWGFAMEARSVRHSKKIVERISMNPSWVTDLLNTVPNIRDRIQAAAQTAITPEQVGFALLGLDMPLKHVASILPDLTDRTTGVGTRYAGGQGGGQGNRWGAYSGLTYYLSHTGAEGVAELSTEQQDNLTLKAEALLGSDDLSALIAKGQQVAAEAAATKAARAAKKATGEKVRDGIQAIPLLGIPASKK